jgi:hypothetical protein
MTDAAPPKPFDLADFMKDISESAKYLKMLIYGEPKVGKTTFAGTAPSPLFLTVEPGTVVLLKDEANRERFKDVKTLDLKNVSTLNRVVAGLNAGQVPDRKTIVLDSLSEFEKRCLLDWNKHAMSAGLTENRNQYAPTWPEYNSVTNILRQAIWNLRDVERHVIIICHTRDDKDKTRGGLSVDRPALMPSLGNSLAAMFNLVGFMSRDNDGKISMQVEGTATVVAGSHIWSGPSIIENPTFDTFNLERAS